MKPKSRPLTWATNKPQRKWITERFLLHKDQAEVVNAAIKRVLQHGAASDKSTNPRGAALTALAAEYISAHGWPDDSPKT